LRAHSASTASRMSEKCGGQNPSITPWSPVGFGYGQPSFVSTRNPKQTQQRESPLGIINPIEDAEPISRNCLHPDDLRRLVRRSQLSALVCRVDNQSSLACKFSDWKSLCFPNCRHVVVDVYPVVPHNIIQVDTNHRSSVGDAVLDR
jgi:hypothetical protein